MPITFRPMALAVVVASSLSCGSGSSPSDAGDGVKTAAKGLTSAAPIFGIASPMAGKAPAATKSSISINQAVARNATALAVLPPGDASLANSPSMPAQLTALAERLEKTTISECLGGIGFNGLAKPVSCYGPTLAYLQHPDAQASMPGGPMVGCQINGDGNGCLPSGDLGLWDASEPNGEACAAATMNSKVLSVSGLINPHLTLMAGMVCAAKVNGSTPPTQGVPLDLADLLAAHVSGASFQTALLERLADRSDGRPTWRISITGTVASTSFSVTVIHAPGDSVAQGQIHGYIDSNNGSAQITRKGFSVGYQVASGKVRYELRSGRTSTSVTPEQLFDANGVYSFETFSQAGQDNPDIGDGVYERAQVDVDTGLGTLIHAWQAGPHDSYTRVFQAHTDSGDNGNDTGFGYFGFGPPLSVDSSLGTIVGMWCNWAGPGSVFKQWPQSVLNSVNVQAQTMARDQASGLFKPVANHILYAPTNSCDVNADKNFVFSTDPNSTNQTLDLLSPKDIKNELIPYGDPSVGEIPDVVAPDQFIATP